MQRTQDEVRLQRKAEKAKLGKVVEKRKKKGVNLNRLSSISGTGGGQSTPERGDRGCFSCGRKGHQKVDCPSNVERRADGGRKSKSKNIELA